MAITTLKPSNPKPQNSLGPLGIVAGRQLVRGTKCFKLRLPPLLQGWVLPRPKRQTLGLGFRDITPCNHIYIYALKVPPLGFRASGLWLARNEGTEKMETTNKDPFLHWFRGLGCEVQGLPGGRNQNWTPLQSSQSSAQKGTLMEGKHSTCWRRQRS